MAKIEIKSSPEELERVATFLRINNIKFKMVNDFGNHSIDESIAYQKLLAKHRV